MADRPTHVLERSAPSPGLPSAIARQEEAFLERFARTFDQGIVVISPGTANEALRRRTRGFSFSNREVDQTLRRIGALGLRAQVFFGYFTPAGGTAELYETRRLARNLVDRFEDHVEVFHLPYSTDRQSPLSRDPEDHGLRCSVTTARDYVRATILGVELEKACKRDDPQLFAAIARHTGGQIDRFYNGLARRLLTALPERALQRDRLGSVVRSYAKDLT